MTTAALQEPDNQSKKAPAWRDVLPVHDAANLFPLISARRRTQFIRRQS
jgi:hypothetical protein